jgi:hypothetical protein
MNPLALIGKVLEVKEGRFIKIESSFHGPLEIFFLVRWTDTNEVFCEYPEKIHHLIKE